MSIEDSISDAPAAQRARAELHHKTRRLGLSWTAIAVRLLALHTDEFAATFGAGLSALPGDPVLSFDPAAILPLLRTLPDGSGDEALVQAMAGTWSLDERAV